MYIETSATLIYQSSRETKKPRRRARESSELRDQGSPTNAAEEVGLSALKVGAWRALAETVFAGLGGGGGAGPFLRREVGDAVRRSREAEWLSADSWMSSLAHGGEMKVAESCKRSTSAVKCHS